MKNCLIGVFIALSQFVVAQDADEDIPAFKPHFQFSGGSQFLVYSQDQNSAITVIVGVNPRYNFVKLGKLSSLSVASYPGLGLSSGGINGFDNRTYFNYDVPVVLQFNVGSASLKSNNKGFGVFLGAGYGINSISKQYFGTNTGFSHGPYGTGGFRFVMQNRLLEARVSYLKNQVKALPENIITLGVAVVFQ
jgi:hypothetical protein